MLPVMLALTEPIQAVSLGATRTVTRFELPIRTDALRTRAAIGFSCG